MICSTERIFEIKLLLLNNMKFRWSDGPSFGSGYADKQLITKIN